MSNIKCLFGFHLNRIIMLQESREVDDCSGVHLRRSVYHCDRCKKNIYKRTDGLIGVNDENWTWFTTGFIITKK